MRVCAVDQSYSSCVVEDDSLLYHTALTYHNAVNRSHKRHMLQKTLRTLFKKYQPSLIVVEAIRIHPSVTTAMALSTLVACIVDLASDI